MKLLRKGDVAILVLAAVLVGGAYGVFWTERTPGRTVLVSVDGRVVEELALDADADLHVEGLIGVSRVLVEDGRVRFVDSPCHARYCVHAGWLSRGGQVAACLPNGVVVEVEGGERAYDAIAL